MNDITTKPNAKEEIKVERPRLHKVILVNDDYTPREFVVMVLKAEFRMSEAQAHRVMITAHQRGACVVAVYTKDVAEAKATNATDAGRRKGYPLLFTTEPKGEAGPNNTTRPTQPWETSRITAENPSTADQVPAGSRLGEANQNFPFGFFHSARGGIGSKVSQCSAILPF